MTDPSGDHRTSKEVLFSTFVEAYVKFSLYMDFKGNVVNLWQ